MIEYFSLSTSNGGSEVYQDYDMITSLAPWNISRLIKNLGCSLPFLDTYYMYAYKQQQTADISLQKNSKRHILRWFGDHILFLARKMLQPTSFIGNIERPSMLKVAVISSSLDHVKRGVETWAKDLGYALKEKGVRVTLYKGSGKINGNFETVIPCLRCGSGVSKAIQRILPPFRWHLGFGSEFQAQQTTFTLNLIPELLIRNFDIVHTQDPDVANIIRVLNKVGLIKAKVILAHGTEEPSEFIRKFDYLQHLAPFHMQEAIAQGINGSKHFAIPNFVDTDKFRPEVKSDLRKELGIPEDAFVVLSVAAIKKVHKRIDYLINSINILNNNKVYLVIAGAKSAETEALIELGKKKLGDRAIFLTDFPRERMNEVYVTADVFVLCSLFEMFGIVFLEAMSSSVPVLGHTHPVFRWIIGEGGECIDMAKEGELAKTIEKYMDESYRKEKGQKARERAVKDFSKDVVVDKIIEMYKEVLECSH